MASRSSFWIMAPIRRSGISMGARRSTLPSIMRLVQQRPAVAAVPSLVDAVQAVKGRAERKPDRAQPQLMDAAVALLVVEGAAVGLLSVVPDRGTAVVQCARAR